MERVLALALFLFLLSVIIEVEGKTKLEKTPKRNMKTQVFGKSTGENTRKVHRKAERQVIKKAEKTGKNKHIRVKKPNKNEINGGEKRKVRRKAEIQKKKKIDIKIRESKKKQSNRKNEKAKKSKSNQRSKKESTKQTNKQSLSSCLSHDCHDTAKYYLKVYKDKVTNYEKQLKRIQKQNETGSGKSDKAGVFRPVVKRLVEAGGGNISAPACNGNSTAPGALQLVNLTRVLTSCEQSVNLSCHHTNLPQPNKTEVELCAATITDFKARVEVCLEQNATAACTCWLDGKLASDVEIVRSCDCKVTNTYFES